MSYKTAAVSCALSPYELCVMHCCLRCRAVLCALLPCVLRWVRCRAVLCALLSCVLCCRLLAFVVVLPSMPYFLLRLLAFVAVLSCVLCCLVCFAVFYGFLPSLLIYVLCIAAFVAMLSCVLCCPCFSAVWFVVLSCMLSCLPCCPGFHVFCALLHPNHAVLASGRTIPVSQTQELEAALHVAQRVELWTLELRPAWLKNGVTQ